MKRPTQQILLHSLALAFLAFLPAISEGQTSSRMKLVLDDGRYSEDSFARQIAVAKDDSVVLTSDFARGVRTFDTRTGALIADLEGHSLPGDAYYDPGSELFVTAGDRKIKMWDWRQQKIVKAITQPFHSQFMNNVYIDSKKTYVFAENAKYSFATGKLLAGMDQRPWSIKVQQEPDTLTYFWDDKYDLFNPATGQVNVYDCLSDGLVKSYTLSAFTPGINNYFDYDSGTLFISYTDGVRIVRISDGSSDRASFDRHRAYKNVDENTSYAVSSDGNYLIAGSNQGEGLVVLRKIDPRKGFLGNTKEVLRRDLSIGEIHALHRSNKVVYELVARCICSISRQCASLGAPRVRSSVFATSISRRTSSTCTLSWGRTCEQCRVLTTVPWLRLQEILQPGVRRLGHVQAGTVSRQSPG